MFFRVCEFHFSGEEKKSIAPKSTAHKLGLASLKRTPSHRTLYAIEKIHHTFFLHLKNTLWVTARFFIINAHVKCSMFSTKPMGIDYKK
jgi:hypothetical protein